MKYLLPDLRPEDDQMNPAPKERECRKKSEQVWVSEKESERPALPVQGLKRHQGMARVMESESVLVTGKVSGGKGAD